MDQAAHAISAIGGQQASHLAQGQAEQLSGLARAQRSSEDMVEDMQPTLRQWVHDDRLLHAVEGDKVAGRLGDDRIAGRSQTEPSLR